MLKKLLFVFVIIGISNNSYSSEIPSLCKELFENSVKNIASLTIYYSDKTSEEITSESYIDSRSVFCSDILKNLKLVNDSPTNSEIAAYIGVGIGIATLGVYVYQSYIAKKSYDLNKRSDDRTTGYSGASSIRPIGDIFEKTPLIPQEQNIIEEGV